MDHLCDASLLLPLCYGGHEHHETAAQWVEEHSGLALCRVTQMALLRLLNNPVVMGSATCAGSAAWKVWDQLLADERFLFLDEPRGFDRELRRYTERLDRSPKLWQDAYLAAFAKTAGVALVTFDAGFRQFRGLQCVVLKQRRDSRAR